MAESFSFELKLVDDVSRQAKKAADAVRAIGSASKKTQASLDFSKDIERSHAALKKLEKDPGGYVKLLKIQKELAEQRKKLASAAGVSKESFSEAIGNKLSFGKLFSADVAADALVEGGMKLGEILLESIHKVVEIFSEGITKAFEESGKEETRRLNFRLSLGEKGGKEALEDIERFSKMTKFTPEQIAPTMLSLRKAGFDQKSARQVFATGADIEASGGMKVDQFAEFAKRVKTKEGVTSKMLVDVLGNVGDSIPSFFRELGKKMHVSAKTAEKMAKEGKIDPQLILNMITASVNKKQGGAAGTGGKAESETFESRLAKLKDLPNQFFKKLVDSPGFAKVSEAFGKLLEKLSPDSPTGQRILASIDAMFTKIIGWFDSLTSDAGIDGLTEGIGTAVGTLEKAVDFAGDLVSVLKQAAAVAEKVAAPLSSAMEFGDKLLNRNQPQPKVNFDLARSPEELQKALKIGVASGVVNQNDVGNIVRKWNQNHVTVNNNTTVNGGDTDRVRKAVADGGMMGVQFLLEKENQMAGG